MGRARRHHNILLTPRLRMEQASLGGCWQLEYRAVLFRSVVEAVNLSNRKKKMGARRKVSAMIFTPRRSSCNVPFICRNRIKGYNVYARA